MTYGELIASTRINQGAAFDSKTHDNKAKKYT